jgi:DNA-nicking Smr family endonuclease
MARKPESDKTVWRSVTADITPLKGRNRPVAEKVSKNEPSPSARGPTAAPPLPHSHKSAPPVVIGRAPGVDRRTAERLRRGQLPIEARLDLHGHTRESAHRVLSDFLAAAWDSGRRVVLIVTGKGQGILKDAVPRWLNEHPNRGRILIVAQAQPKDGGGGALYVLLRRRR